MRNAPAMFALVLLTGLGTPRTVHADPIQIGLTITVTGLKGDPADIFGAPLPIGSVFHGVFSYDPSAPDTDPNTGTGEYRTVNASVSLDAGNGLTQSLDTIFVLSRAADSGIPDLFTASGDPSLPGFYPGGNLFVHFISPSQAVDTDALPQSSEDFLRAFRTGFFEIEANKIGAVSDGFDEGSHMVGGTMVASALTAATPEPGSMLLLGTGLAGLVLRRRRTTA